MYRLPRGRMSGSLRKKLSSAVGRKRSPKPVFSARGKSRAHSGTFIRFPRKRVAAGAYAFAIRLNAEMNPSRQSVLVSKPFRVGKKR
jgi:hypothetical protein